MNRNHYRLASTTAAFLLVSAGLLAFHGRPVSAISSLEKAKLVAIDGAAFDYFGGSVAIRGDTAVVGAFRANSPVDSSGAAYVFKFDGRSWNQIAKLAASDAHAHDFFGRSVAMDGDRIVVGALQDDDAGSSSGSAYVFQFTGTEWVEQTKLIASDGDPSDWFSWSLAISGDTIIVGAPNEDEAGADSGAAYIYHFDGVTWVEQAKLTSVRAGGDHFGYSVDIFRDTTIIGAYGDDDGGSNSGTAYIFQFDGTEWEQKVKLKATDTIENIYFGTAVAIHEGQAIVGALLGYGVDFNSGAAYIFQVEEMEWNQGAKIYASDGGTWGLFWIQRYDPGRCGCCGGRI